MTNVFYYEEEYGFGIWADRVDISENSVEYVNTIREQSDKKDRYHNRGRGKSIVNYLIDTDVLLTVSK